MNKVYLLLGGNIGDVLHKFNKAEKLMFERGVFVKRKSSVYQTKAWGNENMADFLNIIYESETNLDCIILLKNLLEIEKELGRTRNSGEKWTERLIDIDILFYNSDIIKNEPDLIVPHPYIAQRMFTLVPLNELIPNYVHPELKLPIFKLLKHCKDSLFVKKLI